MSFSLSSLFLHTAIKKRSGLAIGIVLLALSSTSLVQAATSMQLDDESYRILARLEAEGVTTSGLLATKPLSRAEISRLYQEALAASEKQSETVRELIAELGRRIDGEVGATLLKPVDALSLSYLHTDAPLESTPYFGSIQRSQPFRYNSEGDYLEQGSNVRAGFESRFENIGPLSLFVDGEGRFADDRDDFVFRSAYGVLQAGRHEILIGRNSQWWGPGYHGALLLSDNAEARAQIKISNPSPLVLPWLFRYLGPFKYEFFVSRLDADRTDYPRPILWGMRFDFKPSRYVEIGLERTAMIGGSGRPLTLSRVFHSVTGWNENIGSKEGGNQIGGGDIKLTIPWHVQPLQLYSEVAGEDKQGGLPFKRAYVMGLYAPRLLMFDRIGFRMEYATNRIPNETGIWYVHSLYRDGYTYKKTVIGHHMGTESRDTFLELNYQLSGSSRISFSRDREIHNIHFPVRERRLEHVLAGSFSLTPELSTRIEYGWGSLTNPENTTTAGYRYHISLATVRYEF